MSPEFSSVFQNFSAFASIFQNLEFTVVLLRRIEYSLSEIYCYKHLLGKQLHIINQPWKHWIIVDIMFKARNNRFSPLIEHNTEKSARQEKLGLADSF